MESEPLYIESDGFQLLHIYSSLPRWVSNLWIGWRAHLNQKPSKFSHELSGFPVKISPLSQEARLDELSQQLDLVLAELSGKSRQAGSWLPGHWRIMGETPEKYGDLAMKYQI